MEPSRPIRFRDVDANDLDTECASCKELYLESEMENGLCPKCWNELTRERNNE